MCICICLCGNVKILVPLEDGDIKSLEDGFRGAMRYMMWVLRLKSCPLQEQYILLTTKPSLQP